MTPVASWSPVDYYHAHLACHRAWLDTQPQFVIPGLLDALDDPSLTPCARKTVHATQQQEAAGTGGIVESVVPPPSTPPAGGGLDPGADPCRTPLLRRGPVAGSRDAADTVASISGVLGAYSTTTGGGANPQPEKRAASQKGA